MRRGLLSAPWTWSLNLKNTTPYNHDENIIFINNNFTNRIYTYFFATISRSFASERWNQIHPTLSNIVLCKSPAFVDGHIIRIKITRIRPGVSLFLHSKLKHKLLVGYYQLHIIQGSFDICWWTYNSGLHCQLDKISEIHMKSVLTYQPNQGVSAWSQQMVSSVLRWWNQSWKYG